MRKELAGVRLIGRKVERLYWLRAVMVVLSGMSLGMSV